MSILHRLVHDREIQLFDGSRLIRKDRFDELKSLGMSDAELNSKGIFRIHPAFRIIALAEPPKLDVSNWLTPEVLSIFLFHKVNNLNKSEEIKIISDLYGSIHPAMSFWRPLLRHCRLISCWESHVDCLNTPTKKFPSTISFKRFSCPSFFPSLPRQILESTLKEFDIMLNREKSEEVQVVIDRDHKLLKIGKTFCWDIISVWSEIKAWARINWSIGCFTC